MVIAIPDTHSDPAKDENEIQLQLKSKMKENKNNGVSECTPTGNLVSTSIPATKGRINLRKGAFFQISFFCFLWNFMLKEFSFSEAINLIDKTDGRFPIFYGTY